MLGLPPWLLLTWLTQMTIRTGSSSHLETLGEKSVGETSSEAVGEPLEVEPSEEPAKRRLQLDRCHHAMLRAPAAHVIHTVGDASSREPPKAFERERRARAIAAQTFASKVVACFDPARPRAG